MKTKNTHKKSIKSTTKSINKKMHSTNGNIVKSLKVTTWNKGPSLLKNSIQNIKSILSSNSIDFLSLQELNLKTHDNLET